MEFDGVCDKNLKILIGRFFHLNGTESDLSKGRDHRTPMVVTST